MTTAEVLKTAELVLKLADVTPGIQIPFLDYCVQVAEAARSLSPRQRSQIKDFKEWAYSWRALFDNYDKEVARDPGIQYIPRNQAALDFHKSTAFIRYFRAGNRTSKTQSGYMEHYFVVTGQYRYRQYPRPPHSTFIVAGLPFTSYMGGVFEAKLITGETANPLSPLFPEGGKWFNHYDDRQHVLTIACPRCAEANKAGSCKHQKSKIRLFSIEQGREVIQGQAYVMGHYDEDIPDVGFFQEGQQRVTTVPGGCLILTGTPLSGDKAWEQTLVAGPAERGDKVDPEDKNSQRFATLHQVSQWDANIVPHSVIKALMQSMDEFQIRARVYGEPMPLADKPVFDRQALQEMNKQIREPNRGTLDLVPDPQTNVLPEMVTLTDGSNLRYNSDNVGPLRVWKEPEPNEIYLVAVDTAAGLFAGNAKTKGDASCASVLKVGKRGSGITLDLVAQYHGWITPLDYADEVYKLALWYNQALLVIETTGGLGLAVVLKIKQEYAYWNLFRDQADYAKADTTIDTRFGVDTNASTKPFMVAALQSLIREKRIHIPCSGTIGELVAFEQITQGKGGVRLSQPKYQGASGSNDDRVMSLAIAAGVAVSYEQLHHEVINKSTVSAQKPLSAEWQQIYKEMKEEQNGSWDW